MKKTVKILSISMIVLAGAGYFGGKTVDAGIVSAQKQTDYSDAKALLAGTAQYTDYALESFNASGTQQAGDYSDVRIVKVKQAGAEYTDYALESFNSSGTQL